MCVPGYISSLITLHNETRAPSEPDAYQFWLVCLVSFFWGFSVSFSNLLGLFYGMADTLRFLHGCWEPQLVQIILCQWSILPAPGTQFSEGTFLYEVIISRIKNVPFRMFRTWTVGRYHVQYCQVTHRRDKSQARGKQCQYQGRTTLENQQYRGSELKLLGQTKGNLSSVGSNTRLRIRVNVYYPYIKSKGDSYWIPDKGCKKL